LLANIALHVLDEHVMAPWRPGGAMNTTYQRHVIQRILGHAQVTTTRIYTEPTDPLTREAAGLIGKALWPDAGKLQPQLQPEAGS
jgi:hypothetical protein